MDELCPGMNQEQILSGFTKTMEDDHGWYLKLYTAAILLPVTIWWFNYLRALVL
jgi:hypothetical protein